MMRGSIPRSTVGPTAGAGAGAGQRRWSPGAVAEANPQGEQNGQIAVQHQRSSWSLPAIPTGTPARTVTPAAPQGSNPPSFSRS